MRATLVFLLVLGFVRPLLAGEDPDAVYIRMPSVVQVKQVSDDKHGKAFALLGSLRFERPGLYTIEAENVILWLDPRVDTQIMAILAALKEKEGALPIWAVRAIYAEGRGRQPVVFQAGGQILRARSMYYDLQRHEGIFLDTELRMRRPENGIVMEKLPDLVFRAERFRARGPGRWTARDVSLFASDYLDPEVELRIRRLDLVNEQAQRAVGELMLLTARGESTMAGPTAEELATLDAPLRAS